jgi:hypothetical protein
MQAFSTAPGITVIVAHGPYIGCSAWRKMGSFAGDDYLAGAFAAGMVEATRGGASLVDGGELYELRSDEDFRRARDWRKGVSRDGASSIATLSPMNRCPFMSPALASRWSQGVEIAFGTFDKHKERGEIAWTPISTALEFRKTLTNALRATDRYVWHYAEWQDWWGTSTEDKLGPWIEAVKGARRDAASR